MLDFYYEDYLKLNPTTATFKGDDRYNDQIENPISADYRKQSLSLIKRYTDSLHHYEFTKLSDKDQLSYRIFEYELQNRLEGSKYDTYLTPVSQMNDFRISFSQMGSGAGIHPFKTVKDYDDFLKRMNGFVAWTDTAIANMRKGMKLGIVQPRVVMVKVIPQIRNVMTDSAQKSMFYKPITNFPSSFSVDDKARLTKAYEQAIVNLINPAYKRLLDFIEKEYMPATRESVGLLALPNGREMYNFRVRSWTTTNITPDEVFELGKSEVARIRKEMESIKDEIGFKGDLKTFFEFMSTDPKFFPFKTETDVVNAFQQIYEKMKPNLPKQFNIVPKTRFEIRPVEKYRAATTAAHYMTGTPDGSRAGVFYFPVLDATKYSYWRMEDLFLHEAIPGHHFERSLSAENTNLPGNQKIGSYGAYTEGWGLYSERLGKELGLYTDPYQRMGQLQGEMHRAVRLVVDAGLHSKGWTREQAIQYSLDNEPITEANAIQEIERYISMPGQALSYKLGELKILEMRKKAESSLGKKFDACEFHDQVLKDGAMPLTIFESKMNQWIVPQKIGTKK
ncbi:MAG: DUF885 domain-containing protein [Bacteroidetes bacterium]|nr:DUF885 domain-containing protein [Bacteroidota bacterium]